MPDTIARIFGETLGIDPLLVTDDVSPDTAPKWDSLTSLALVASLQEAFSVEFSTTEIMAMRTVGLVRKVLRRKGVLAA